MLSPINSRTALVERNRVFFLRFEFFHPSPQSIKNLQHIECFLYPSLFPKQSVKTSGGYDNYSQNNPKISSRPHDRDIHRSGGKKADYEHERESGESHNGKGLNNLICSVGEERVVCVLQRFYRLFVIFKHVPQFQKRAGDKTYIYGVIPAEEILSRDFERRQDFVVRMDCPSKIQNIRAHVGNP